MLESSLCDCSMRHSIGQAAVNHVVTRLPSALPKRRRQLRKRHPRFGVEGPLHAFGHHADDRDRQPVDTDRLADDRRIPRVARFPDAVADQQDGWCAGAIVLRSEGSSERGCFTNEVEAVGRDIDARILFRVTVVGADVQTAVEHQRHPRKCLAGALQVVEVLKRIAEGAASCITPVDPHDPIGFVEGQTPQQDRVHQREHRAVGADAQRERGDRREREPPILDEPPGGEANVLQDALHVRPPPLPAGA